MVFNAYTNILELPFPKIPIGSHRKFTIIDDNLDRYHIDNTIEPLFTLWMNPLMSSGESGIIGRDDCLLNILHYSAGLTEKQRDMHDISTTNKTRVDRSDSYANIPLVLTEEKNVENINEGIKDLTRKFRWIPHYENLPFVFGIAINRNTIKFGKLTPSRNFIEFASLSLDIDEHRLRCVFIVIQIATVLRYFIDRGLFIHSELPLNRWIDRGEKRIRISLQYVEIQYSISNPKRYKFLKAMYNKTKEIPFKETLVQIKESQFDDSSLIIRLLPVGISREPKTISELKKCLVCILTCLIQFHAAGYVHCDIRWKNIIKYQEDWYLIDFEYAVSLRDEAGLKAISGIINHEFVRSKLEKWDPSFDYYQVGKLIQHSIMFSEMLEPDYSKFKSIKDKLLSPSKRLSIAKIISEINNI